MSSRPHVVALGGVAVLVLVLLGLREPAAAGVKSAIGSLFLPLFGVVGSGQELVGRVGTSLTPRSGLLRELSDLRRQNERLRLQALQGAEASRENDRLRALLGWSKSGAWTGKAARVIGRDTASWWRTLRIDVGERDGVRSNLPVITPEGLVGRVGAVGRTTSEVVLVGDPTCRVSVYVQETGEQGVLSAASSGVLDHRLVDLTHLPRNTVLRPGQMVFTGGMGGVFPSGLPVGTIVDHRSVGYGLYTEARVKLRVDTARIREVMVLLL